MAEIPAYKILPCGDHAITLHFGNVIDEAINQQVLLLFKRIKRQHITGVKDVIPAYSSITVVYDVVSVRRVYKNSTAYNSMLGILTEILYDDEELSAQIEKTIRIPVCYEPAFALDLYEMAVRKHMQPEDIARLHYSKTYTVFMLGFLPGFAYMGTTVDELAMPRKSTPRASVKEGSVGVAGKQTGIYPLESPGGWNIIGQTPLKMFDVAKPEAVMLMPGDKIQFYPITGKVFNDIKAAQ